MRMAFLLAFALIISTGMGLPEEKKADGAGKPRPATVLYKVKAGATDEAKAALADVLRKHDIKGVRKLVRGLVEQARADAQGPASEEDLCKALVDTGAVEFAEVDALIAPVGTPVATDYDKQWHQTKIDAPGAWVTTAGSATVLVAVLDTGVQADHPDLTANLQLPGRNTVSDNEDTSPVADHGTMTSGCVAALAGNVNGVCGVAPGVKVLPVRVSNLSTGSAYISDMAEGITWAADHGAKVANLSYGGANSPSIDTAAKYLRTKGGLLFMSAGNDGKNQTHYPDFTSFVAVSATDASDLKASFSTYGTFVDVAAPGVSIYTTTTGGAYAAVNGTSFSSPITAGVAALIYSVKVDFTPAQVESILFSTCDYVGDAAKFGNGRVNAAKAVAMAKQIASGNQLPVAAISASPTSGVAPLLVTLSSGSADPDGTIASQTWQVGGTTIGTDATINYSFAAAGSYTVKLTVVDDKGAEAQAVQVITVTSGGGKPRRK